MQCGAKNRNGTRCKRGGGWGTDHKGYGRCKMHGGMSPPGRVAGARLALMAEGLKLGMGLDVSADTLMTTTVQQAAGALQVAATDVASDPESPERRRYYGEALDRAAAIAKMAVTAGIARAQVRMAQRTAQMISGAFDAALRDTPAIDERERTALVARFAKELIVLEQRAEEPVAIEGHARG